MKYLFQIRSERIGEDPSVTQNNLFQSLGETLNAQEHILCDKSKISFILHEVTGEIIIMILHILTKFVFLQEMDSS
jgi:hypothetical protein